MTKTPAPSETELSPPPGIGPHEGRELALMLAGTKPLACFSELTRADFDWPDAHFQPYVRAGTLLKRVFLHREIVAGMSEEVRSLYFARPGEAWRIDAAHRNRRRTYAAGRESDADAREMGRLLGYSEAEIAAFLAWRSRVRAMVRAGTWTPART